MDTTYSPTEFFKSQREKILSCYNNADEILNKGKDEKELEFEKDMDLGGEMVKSENDETTKEDDNKTESKDDVEKSNDFDILSAPIL